MRISHADAGKRERTPRCLDRLLDQFITFDCAWKRGRFKCGPSHFYRHGTRIAVAIDVELDGHQAALGFHSEALLLCLPRGVKIARKNAEPVAGFLCLAPVRIKNAQAEIRLP